jgi:predicted amidophosphoribosyltransferase
MHGAFRSNLRGKNLPEKLLLVDDVMTTGATLIEAVKVLKAGGVSEVFPIVLARTP